MLNIMNSRISSNSQAVINQSLLLILVLTLYLEHKKVDPNPRKYRKISFGSYS